MLCLAASCLGTALSPTPARSFCGFYVATGDAKLFNQSSQVVLVRDADRTVLTMGSDFKGAPAEFALVVPVPTVLERDQIHVGDAKIVAHLDAYSAPRLVEYFDEDPCMMVKYEKMMLRNAAPTASVAASFSRRWRSDLRYSSAAGQSAVPVHGWRRM